MDDLIREIKTQNSHKVFFGHNFFKDEESSFFKLIKGYRKKYLNSSLVLFIDENVYSLHKEKIHSLEKNFSFKSIIKMIVPEGEKSKNDFNLVLKTLENLKENNIDRHSLAIGIGGGSTLDFAGFVTSIYHRGMRLIKFPTTVLAQNDAGIGIKNGVNLFGAKNFIGTFQIPYAVFNDSDFLMTLPQREISSGLVESVKVAMLKDESFYNWIYENRKKVLNKNGPELQYAIKRGAELHIDHITQGGDPFEEGSARPLDLGHWLGHRLEIETKNGLRHGEAVANGILLDLSYAVEKKMALPKYLKKTKEIFEAFSIKNQTHVLLSRSQNRETSLSKALNDFAEHLGGKIEISLPISPGTYKNETDLDIKIYKKILTNVSNYLLQ